MDLLSFAIVEKWIATHDNIGRGNALDESFAFAISWTGRWVNYPSKNGMSPNVLRITFGLAIVIIQITIKVSKTSLKVFNCLTQMVLIRTILVRIAVLKRVTWRL